MYDGMAMRPHCALVTADDTFAVFSLSAPGDDSLIAPIRNPARQPSFASRNPCVRR
jgi:hypothetical protein